MSNLKIFTDNIESEALNQINTLIEQPAFSNCKVRIMPDVHAGAGCVIGFTADLGDKVIPNIVGVDIGCGMLTVKLGNIDIDFEKLDNVIRRFIPSGRAVHNRKIFEFCLHELYCYRELKNIDRIERSIGTLGGGNHFIEIDTDDEGCKYLIIHTGSRNLGKQVAEIYQKLATMLMKKALYEERQKLIKDYKAEDRDNDIEQGLKDLVKSQSIFPEQLAYLTGKEREYYLHDMEICQQYANLNRSIIAFIIINKMDWEIESFFETIHNYVDFESNIVRKGAISAEKGEQLLIPINMRDGCIIGIGKGNPEWNYSAPHGAGRIMSRSKAKENISLDDFEEAMKGIFTTSVNTSTIDESPMAYKNIDEIINNIHDTVRISKIIKPIYNYKASE